MLVSFFGPNSLCFRPSCLPIFPTIDIVPFLDAGKIRIEKGKQGEKYFLYLFKLVYGHDSSYRHIGALQNPVLCVYSVKSH